MPSKLTHQEFIRRAKKIHGNKYDYSRVVYSGTKYKVTIGCPRHGWFEQVVETHIYNKSGCPVCSDNGTVEERFWSFVDRNGPRQSGMADCCWVWRGSLHYKGYGQFRDGHMVKAHVFSYELHYGTIPADGNHYGRKFVLHHCDNPSCVRPSHLFLGTHQDNMDDMMQKGRRGTPSSAKLTRSKVRSIREMYDSGKYSQIELGKLFGVDRNTIGSIVRMKTWKE